MLMQLVAMKFGIWFLFQSWDKIAFVAGALALWWAVQAGREKWRVYRSKGWPTCPGAVENLAVRKVDGGMNGVDYWKVSFDYRYRVTEEHVGSYKFNCTSEEMAHGAMVGLEGKTVSVHTPPANEGKGIVWEDEVWDVWWETYWAMSHRDVAQVS